MVMNNTKTEERKQHGANGALRQTLVVHPELKLSFNGLQANPYRSASCPLTVGGSAGKSAARVGGPRKLWSVEGARPADGGAGSAGRGARRTRAKPTGRQGQGFTDSDILLLKTIYILLKN
jgi:hypothetical protein